MYLALSPDGRQVIYTGSRGGSDWALYIRDLDQLDSRLLPGTEGAVAPEFSPDGKWIAFGAPDGSLKKLMVDGTSLTTLWAVAHDGLADFAFAMQGLGSGAITLAGTPALKERYLPRVARGSMRSTRRHRERCGRMDTDV